MSILTGSLIHLSAFNADTDAETFGRWQSDSEYHRLFSSGAARPWATHTAREELNEAPNPNWLLFAIRARADDRLLGLVDFDLAPRPHANAWLGIAIGNRADWGHGYGTDAMRVALRYAFTELNAHRASLSVFEYNARAIRVYEKLGFVLEGRQRQRVHRNGQRWDMLFMGMLKEEWETRNSQTLTSNSQL